MKSLAGRCGLLAAGAADCCAVGGALYMAPSELADQFGRCGSAGWWLEELRRLAEVEALLRQQADALRQQQAEDGDGEARWWAPFVSTLQAYCSAADKEGGDGVRRFLQTPRHDACAPVVMMVAALAAGQLRTSIQFDGAPRLAVHGSMVAAETMEVKSSLKGLRQARQQLLASGQVMVWLLRVANRDLLKGRQLQLRGVLAVQGHLAAWQWWEAEREMQVASFGVTTTMKPEVEVF